MLLIIDIILLWCIIFYMRQDNAIPADKHSVRGWPFAALAILLAMIVNAVNADIVRMLGINQWFETIPYGHALLLYALDLATVVIGFWLIGGVSLKRQWTIIGLAKPVVPPLVFGAIIFIPVIIVLLVLTSPADKVNLQEVSFTGLVFPMFEEITFRGLAIGVLMAHFRWPFLAAILVPSLFFGAFHMYQGNSLIESLSIALITAIGAVWFGWIYWKWGFNLWPAFMLHAGLNLLWPLFDLGDNAMGGQLGNIMRVVVIAVSIVLTLWARGLIDRLAYQRRIPV